MKCKSPVAASFIQAFPQARPESTCSCELYQLVSSKQVQATAA